MGNTLFIGDYSLSYTVIGKPLFINAFSPRRSNFSSTSQLCLQKDIDSIPPLNLYFCNIGYSLTQK